jgi:hypothetical protein
VWKRFSKKKFTKALAVLPFDPVPPPIVSERANELLSAGYERAAEECRRKVRKIIQECRRVNMRYRDPGFDLVCFHFPFALLAVCFVVGLSRRTLSIRVVSVTQAPAPPTFLSQNRRERGHARRVRWHFLGDGTHSHLTMRFRGGGDLED